MSLPPGQDMARRPLWLRGLEWGLVAALIGGIGAYLFWKPLNPMADPKAAHALALVQTHSARSAPSIRQALDGIMRANEKPGRSAAMSDWTVQRNNRTQDREGYLVRVEVRLPGDQPHRWVEWEYLWLVRLSPAAVIPLSRPAAEVMP
jgi:hypothetical protein